jgi:hypothetical protein
VLPEPFDCPRCAQPVAEQHYGPCEGCRAELRATYDTAGQHRNPDPQAADYEPKMNVTPNAVALKDD